MASLAEGLVAAEPIDPLIEETESKGSSTQMVVQRKMTDNHFLPGGRSTLQQQVPPPPCSLQMQNAARHLKVH